ncbi:MAG TPA: hypothetical protein GXX37_01805 [Clostridiaceae bacterium]|nr:hypothetical protein [Clostridiaceae bacterium]
MKLTGTLIIGTKTIKKITVEKDDPDMSFHDILEECFIDLCKGLDIPVPIWMKKNTTEFSAFRRTFFTNEQFTEKVNFDRLEIRMHR